MRRKALTAGGKMENSTLLLWHYNTAVGSKQEKYERGAHSQGLWQNAQVEEKKSALMHTLLKVLFCSSEYEVKEN